jgi:integrase
MAWALNSAVYRFLVTTLIVADFLILVVQKFRAPQSLKAEPDDARRAFCATVFYACCRISETLNLAVERIDLTECTVVFETLKRRPLGHFRTVPIPATLALILGKIVRERPPNARIRLMQNRFKFGVIARRCQPHPGRWRRTYPRMIATKRGFAARHFRSFSPVARFFRGVESSAGRIAFGRNVLRL